MVCLDTDFLVGFLRGDRAAEEKMSQLSQLFEQLTVTPVSAAEIFFGAFKSNRKNAAETAENFLSTIEMLEFDLPAARKAGQLIASLQKEGQQIGEKDQLIAAIAIRHNQTLVTRNKKHFPKVPCLKIAEW